MARAVNSGSKSAHKSGRSRIAIASERVDTHEVKPDRERQKALMYELATLPEQQQSSLQKAIFLACTHEEATAYDLRAARMEAIRRLLAESDSEPALLNR